MAPVARIASMLASATEILHGLGLGESVVAVSHECDYPPEALDKPRVTFTRVAIEEPSAVIDGQVRVMLGGGQSLYEIDVAALERLRPDLIVTQAQCDVCAIRYQDVIDVVAASDRLRGARIVALNPNTLDEILRDIENVASAAGVPERAASYRAALQSRIDAVRGRTISLPSDARPRVACIEWIEPLMVAANWMPELVEMAGGRHDLTRTGRHSTYTDWQSVVEYGPEVIVVAPCGLNLERTDSELHLLQSLPGWRQLPAVRAGRVFSCDGNAYFNRSGPRMVDTLELQAHLIHPERFDPPACCQGQGAIWRRVESA